MNPIRTPATTAVLGTPRNWNTDDGECEGLPIATAHGTMFSYWKPSPVDILRLMRGRPIRLGVFGTSHPPVTIDTEE